MNEEIEEIKNKIEETLSQELPQSLSGQWLLETFGTDEILSQKGLDGLLTPTRDLVKQGGKRWRPLFMLLCAKMATKDPEKIQNALSLCPLLEFVHTASLIHDDIEDRADERRGKPCAYITHGLDTALNAGSWLYFKAASCIKKLDLSPERRLFCHELYEMELRRLHLGQAMDIAWHRDSNFFPSVEEYKQMVQLKTGTLSCMAARFGFFAAEKGKDLIEKAGLIAAGIGMGFQVLDDVQNLTSGNPGKKRGDDIVEGKKSLPVLLCVQENPCAKEKISGLFEKAAKEGIESPAIEDAIKVLNDSDSIQKAYDFGNKCVQEKALELTSLLEDNGSGARQMILDLFNKIQR
ncbi:MAG: polyprenyl synthetase family protein [Treponema sp.]|nr:polyprenyl synthetase family protein [Treponema sp.]